MYGELPSELKYEFVHVHAVHLMEVAQELITANLSAQFTYNGYVKAIMIAANSYVHLFEEN